MVSNVVNCSLGSPNKSAIRLILMEGQSTFKTVSALQSTLPYVEGRNTLLLPLRCKKVGLLELLPLENAVAVELILLM